MNTFLIRVGRTTRAGKLDPIITFAVNSESGQSEVHSHYRGQYAGLDVGIEQVLTLDLNTAIPKVTAAKTSVDKEVIHSTGYINLYELGFEEERTAIGKQKTAVKEAQHDLTKLIRAKYTGKGTLFSSLDIDWEREVVVFNYEHGFKPREINLLTKE